MKCLNQEGVRYLWSRIKELVKPFATTSQLNAGLSGLQTQLNTKANMESGTCALKVCSEKDVVLATATGVYKKIGNLVYIQAMFQLNEVPSEDMMLIKGFPFTVPYTGGGTRASDLHYKTDLTQDDKTLNVFNTGDVRCPRLKTSKMFIYGTYILQEA